MLPSWANDTIIRIRPGKTSKRGSEILDWDNPQIMTIMGCSVQPTVTTMSQDGRVLGVSETYSCYMPEDADVISGDKVLFGDKEYQVNGEPLTWVSPSGRVSNKQVTLERWSG